MESRAYFEALSSPVLDRLARLVTKLLSVPVSVVTLIENGAVNFPGQCGLTGTLAEQRAVPLAHALARFVVQRGAPLVVADAREESLLREHPAHTVHGVVAYAGVPLRRLDGTVLGALGAIDTDARPWSTRDLSLLEDLAAAAVSEIELRMTERRLVAAETALRELEVRDGLTGLFNRRGFADRARIHLAQSQRNATPFSIARIDIDRFRQINEVCGHDVGDEALVEVATMLTDICRDVDVVSRLGGDEFMVLLSDTGDVGATAFRQRLAKQLHMVNAKPERTYALSVSVGVASWTAEAQQSYPTLLRVADEALMAHKRARRVGSPPA